MARVEMRCCDGCGAEARAHGPGMPRGWVHLVITRGAVGRGMANRDVEFDDTREFDLCGACAAGLPACARPPGSD
jgi:hypothetical protein